MSKEKPQHLATWICWNKHKLANTTCTSRYLIRITDTKKDKLGSLNHMYRHYCILFVFCLPGYWVAYKKLNKTLSSYSNHQESLHILDLCLHQLKSNNGERLLKSEDFLYYKDASLIFLITTNSFTLLVNFYGMMVLIRIGRRNSEYIANRITKMISFKPGKEIKKDVFCLVTSVGQRKCVQHQLLGSATLPILAECRTSVILKKCTMVSVFT